MFFHTHVTFPLFYVSFFLSSPTNFPFPLLSIRKLNDDSSVNSVNQLHLSVCIRALLRCFPYYQGNIYDSTFKCFCPITADYSFISRRKNEDPERDAALSHWINRAPRELWIFKMASLPTLSKDAFVSFPKRGQEWNAKLNESRAEWKKCQPRFYSSQLRK